MEKAQQTPDAKPKVNYQEREWAVVGHSRYYPDDDPTLTLENEQGEIITLSLSECKLLEDIIIPKSPL